MYKLEFHLRVMTCGMKCGVFSLVFLNLNVTFSLSKRWRYIQGVRVIASLILNLRWMSEVHLQTALARRKKPLYPCNRKILDPALV